MRLDKATYPAGVDLTLPADPKTKLSVYTGEFAIQARIVASPGNHLVEAKLRFQACDQAQCLPPKTIPVAIDVIGKYGKASNSVPEVRHDRSGDAAARKRGLRSARDHVPARAMAKLADFKPSKKVSYPRCRRELSRSQALRQWHLRPES